MNPRMITGLSALVIALSTSAAAATYHFRQASTGMVAEQPPLELTIGTGTDNKGACASGAATGCATYSDGTLVKLINSVVPSVAHSSICKSSGKWYMEMTYTPRTWGSNTQNASVGLSTSTSTNIWAGYAKYTAAQYIHLVDHPIAVTDDVGTGVPNPGVPLHSSVAVLGIALDADAHNISFMLDGATKTVHIAAPADACFYFEAATIAAYGTWNGDVNFGQNNFTYTVPQGYHRGWW